MSLTAELLLCWDSVLLNSVMVKESTATLQRGAATATAFDWPHGSSSSVAASDWLHGSSSFCHSLCLAVACSARYFGHMTQLEV